jgi:hypothetical protein
MTKCNGRVAELSASENLTLSSAPTDPDVQNYRIRFLRAMDSLRVRMNDTGRSQPENRLRKHAEALPRHPPATSRPAT